MIMENAICQTIVKYRKAAGLSQQKLGELVGVSPQAISRWENGGMPDAASMPKLAQVLGCSLDDLYGVSTSVPSNIEDLITRELRRLPEDDRLKRGISIAWHVLKILISSGFSSDESFQHNFDMLSSIDNTPPEACIPPDAHPSSIPSATICNALTNHAIMQASTAPDFKYVLLMADPADGYGTIFRNVDAYRDFYALLCRPGRLDILLLGMTLPPDKNFTRDYICAHLELSREQVQEALDDLCDHQLLQFHSIQDTDGDVFAYKVFVDPCLIYFLHFSSLLMRNNNGYYSMNTSSRTAPLVKYLPDDEAATRSWTPASTKNVTPRAVTHLYYNRPK